MTILITGGSGFIGSALARQLHREGRDPAALSRTPDRAAPWPSFKGDVRDRDLMLRLCPRGGTVYHLASVVGPRQAALHHRDTITTAIEGTANAVDACVNAGAILVLTSTSDAYGIPGPGHGPFGMLREDRLLWFGPPTERRWAYGMAKSLAEQIVLEAVETKGLDARIVRLFNVVGPGQNPAGGFLFPSFALAAAQGQPLHIHGQGTQRRTFLGVDDCLMGLRRIAACEEARGRVVNLGSPHPWSVLDVARLFRTAALTHDNREIAIVHDDPEGTVPPASDAPIPDLGLARELIAWESLPLVEVPVLVGQIYRWARDTSTSPRAA